MRGSPVPKPSVKRVSMYLRQLEHLDQAGVDRVSSRKLAEALRVGPAQIRRDLALFGQFGKPGIGYHVQGLMHQLRLVLGTHEPWNVIVVGAGQLGRALLRYAVFPKRGFRLVAAFDIAPEKIGRKIGPIVVQHIDDVGEVIRAQEVKLAILTVPASAAPQAAHLLHDAGVRGILNFAPARLDLPDGIAVNHVDLAARLERLSFEVSYPGRRAETPPPST